MRNIAIIPARSGSKGIKDKNIKNLCGKPLMAYTIEAAIHSRCFDEVMVSTDSDQYAEIAKKYGASVPFLRSRQTSTDTASSWDMIREVLSQYETFGISFDTFCLLQPTSPLRRSEDIVSAYSLFQNKARIAVVSVCEAEHSPLWCGKLPNSQELIGFIDSSNARQRQGGDKYYRLNGALYIVNIMEFYNGSSIYGEGSFAYIMEQTRSVDIDTELDFKLASVILGGGTE